MQILRHLPRIHPAGVAPVLIFAIVTWLFGTYYEPLGWVGVVLTLWCVYFFRNPERVTPEGNQWVISPADGVVCNITEAAPPAELRMGEEPLTRVSVFLNVFDVHINRIPSDGKITQLYYHPGKFLNAELDKASIHNERQCVVMEKSDGSKIIFVQIAGLVARRIVCELDEGQEVKAGEIFGLIRFGSRMDVYLPKGVNPLVVVGQRAVAGETVLANLESGEPARVGVKH